MSRVTTAKLGWSNGNTKEESLRLYATDIDESPRWAPDGGRTIERALVQSGHEGDRYLVIHLGSRFVPDEKVTRIAELINDMLISEGLV